MKTKEKRVRNKAQIRAMKKRERSIVTAIILTLILVVVIVSVYFAYTFLSQTMNPASSQLKAAIVDHLSLTFPNQTFIQAATNILKQAGYTVDYYPGEEVDVEFYRNLPTRGYGLIIFRVHSALRYGAQPPVVFFTSETSNPYKYPDEFSKDRLVRAAYNESDLKQGRTYFGITPQFVRQDMKGKFQGTTIIMMGCDGLTGTEMAEALIQKGAKVYISWKESVSASRTDQATTQLLKHLIIEKQTVEQAVTETMGEVGPDPAYNSILLYYPHEFGNYIIPSTAS